MKAQGQGLLFPWLLVFYEVSIYLSMDAYVPALPIISHVFSVSAHMVQLTAVSWILGGLVMQLAFGPLSDRYGRRPILLFGGILYILSTIGCAIAGNIHVLIVARFFQGGAMPSMFIAGYAAINEWFNSKEAIKILARMNSMTILAPAFGPLLGGACLLLFNWRWIFVILAMWSLIAIIALFFKMPETIPPEEKVSKLHVVEIIRQYTKVTINAQFMISSLVAFLPVVGLIVWMLAGPFIVVHRFHYTTLDFGIMQTAIFGCFIIGTSLVNRYANDERNPFLINLGLGSSLIGATFATLTGWLLPNALFILVASVMLMTFGSGLSIPILSRLTLETSDAPMGIRITIFSVMRMGCGFLGSICLTLFYKNNLLSMAIIMLVFTTAATILRILLCYTALGLRRDTF